jgi:hypothetical protein
MNPQDFKLQWDTHIPEFPVTIEQVDLWFALHTGETISKGLLTTLSKWSRDKAAMGQEYLIRYTSKTMNNEKSRRRAQQVSQ